MSGVDDMRFCEWEGETLPVDHDCVGDPTPCKHRREDGSVCGWCDACLASQESDPRYGPRGGES